MGVREMRGTKPGAYRVVRTLVRTYCPNAARAYRLYTHLVRTPPYAPWRAPLYAAYISLST